MIRSLLALVLCSMVATAQVRFDAGVGLAFPSASTAFRSLPGFPSCCPEFTSGSGTGLALGIGADVPLLDNILLSVRGSTVSHGHSLTTQERISVIVDGRFTSADVTHQIDLTQQVYSADVLLGYRLNLITVRAGLGYLVRGPGTIAAEERLDNPVGATFVDTQSPVRNVRSGALPDAVQASWQVGASIGVAFPLDARKQWQVEPEVGVSVPLASVTTVVAWKLTVPTAMVRLSWSPFGAPAAAPTVQAATKAESPTDELLIVDTPPTPTATTVQLDIVGNPTVVIEEVEQETFLPVLPYVFFAQDEATMPQRYVRMFHQSLPAEAEPAYAFHHRLLAVVAERMRQVPDAVVTIIGTTSSRERNPMLAEQRAQVVASILRDTFGIANERLVVRSQGLPDSPTKATPEESAMADEENSRVELEASDPRILMPYYVSDTTVVMSPPQLHIVARTSAPGSLKQWTLTINDDEVRSSAQAFSKPVVFQPDASAVRSLLEAGALRIRIDGEIDGEPRAEETLIPVQQKRLVSKRQTIEQDSVVEVFQLVLFPYNSATLTAMHRRVLDVVRQRLGSRARLTIEGATDVIGSAEANADLSTRRAQAVADYLGVEAVAVGRGEPSSSIQQSLPEQRMLERTVRIRAAVPVRER